MRQGRVFCNGIAAGILTEDEHGYTFAYDEAYLRLPERPVQSSHQQKNRYDYIAAETGCGNLITGQITVITVIRFRFLLTYN